MKKINSDVMGWAVVINDRPEIFTVSSTEKGAMMRYLFGIFGLPPKKDMSETEVKFMFNERCDNTGIKLGRVNVSYIPE